MKRKHFPIIIEQDADGVFIVTCPVFKGCHSYGSTIEEAIANITEAIGSCIEDTFFDDYTQFVGVVPYSSISVIKNKKLGGTWVAGFPRWRYRDCNMTSYPAITFKNFIRKV